MRRILLAIAVLAVGFATIGGFMSARASKARGAKARAFGGVQARNEARLEPLSAAPIYSRSTPREPQVQGVRAAHVHGQLFLGAATGVEQLADILRDLTLRARKGSDGYSIDIDEQGNFEAHLPPGHYTSVALGERWVGQTEVMELTVESERTVEVVLEEAARVSGVVIDASDPEDVLELTISDGSDEAIGMLFGDDGTFEATGLIPGVDYQLSLPGFTIIEPRDGWVRAPARDVSLRVKRGPVLLGSMGLEPGMDCPLNDGNVYRSDEYDPSITFGFDSSCSFEVKRLEPGTQGRLVASGGGWHFDVAFLVPPTGDPDPICLNPPCRNLP